MNLIELARKVGANVHLDLDAQTPVMIRFYIDELQAFAAALSCASSAPWHFRRFVDGQEMAEDVMVERAATLEEAVNAAAKICPKRPMTVLVHSCAPTGVKGELPAACRHIGGCALAANPAASSRSDELP